MWISSGGHFEIQYGGHKEKISSGPISENVRNILMFISAKFDACITKCAILLNIWAKPWHYIVLSRVLNHRAETIGDSGHQKWMWKSSKIDVLVFIA